MRGHQLEDTSDSAGVDTNGDHLKANQREPPRLCKRGKGNSARV